MMLVLPTSSFPPFHLRATNLPAFTTNAIRRIGHDSSVVSPVKCRRGTWTPNRNPTQISSSNDNQTVVVDEKSILVSSSTVVRKFYDGINSHDLASVEGLIAENCVYEDLIFPKPFVGREVILQFFKKFTDSVSTDLQFVIDDISDENTAVVGVTWHLEWKGKNFPFSKGCSFYRLEVVKGQRQIINACYTTLCCAYLCSLDSCWCYIDGMLPLLLLLSLHLVLPLSIMLPVILRAFKNVQKLWARHCGTCYQACRDSFGCYQRCHLATATVSTVSRLFMMEAYDARFI